MGIASRIREGGIGRPLRYLGSGGALVALDWAVFSLLVLAGLIPGLAQVAARATGALAGFLLQKLLVFRDGERRVGGLARQGLAYLALALANILLSGLLVALLAGGAGLPALLAKLLVDLALAGETYLLLHFVFREDSPP